MKIENDKSKHREAILWNVNRFLDNACFIISEINSKIFYKFLTLTCVKDVLP